MPVERMSDAGFPVGIGATIPVTKKRRVPGVQSTVQVHAGEKKIILAETIPFLLLHVACLAALWTGVTWQAVSICVGLYVLRMVGVTAGYHRYFSHKAYKTGRV